jgi:hypothetical protein
MAALKSRAGIWTSSFAPRFIALFEVCITKGTDGGITPKVKTVSIHGTGNAACLGPIVCRAIGVIRHLGFRHGIIRVMDTVHDVEFKCPVLRIRTAKLCPRNELAEPTVIDFLIKINPFGEATPV